MLLASVHQSTNNVYGYGETNPGSQAITNLLEISSADLSSYGGMLLANGFLYAVNGGKVQPAEIKERCRGVNR